MGKKKEKQKENKRSLYAKIIGVIAFSEVESLCVYGFITDVQNRLSYAQIALAAMIVVWGAISHKNHVGRIMNSIANIPEGPQRNHET